VHFCFHRHRSQRTIISLGWASGQSIKSSSKVCARQYTGYTITTGYRNTHMYYALISFRTVLRRGAGGGGQSPRQARGKGCVDGGYVSASNSEEEEEEELLAR
jgi:hypothetical protein